MIKVAFSIQKKKMWKVKGPGINPERRTRLRLGGVSAGERASQNVLLSPVSMNSSVRWGGSQQQGL